jgi:hypothetical protein
MRFFERKHLVHWIAILAIFVGSIAPSISQAVSLAKSGHGFVMEICSAEGSKISKAVDVSEQNQEQSAESCPYCLAHIAYALPLNPTLSLSAPQDHSLYSKLFYQSPKPLFAWVSLPSRAPPSNS